MVWLIAADPGQARVGSPARGRAGLGFPEAAFYLPTKADGDRDGKAGPRVARAASGDARGSLSILLLLPLSRALRGGTGAGHAQLPGSGFHVGASPRPGPAATHRAGLAQHPRPAAPQQHAQGSLAGLQPSWGAPKTLLAPSEHQHRRHPGNLRYPPFLATSFRSQQGESDLAARVLRMRVPRTDNRSPARSKSLFLPSLRSCP